MAPFAPVASRPNVVARRDETCIDTRGAGSQVGMTQCLLSDNRVVRLCAEGFNITPGCRGSDRFCYDLAMEAKLPVHDTSVNLPPLLPLYFLSRDIKG